MYISVRKRFQSFGYGGNIATTVMKAENSYLAVVDLFWVKTPARKYCSYAPRSCHFGTIGNLVWIHGEGVRKREQISQVERLWCIIDFVPRWVLSRKPRDVNKNIVNIFSSLS